MKLSIFDLFIYRPLGTLIRILYNLVENYGLAIILFTIIIKLILMPLQVKSQRAMRRQQKVQPIIAELQKKYANDQQRLSQEMMKVYKENNISLTGGCLPLLIQFPILIGLYKVIQRPLTYIRNVVVDSELISSIASKVGQAATGDEIQLAEWANQAGMDIGINFNFLGLNLSEKPSRSLNSWFTGDFSEPSIALLILIPAIAMLLTWLSSKYSQRLNGTAPKKNTRNTQENPTQSMAKTMNMLMPLMTGFFTFTLPSGIGIYWIISSLMQIVQQFLITKFFDRKEDDFVVKVPEKNRKGSKKHR